jgi:hypothetical protein
MRKDRAFARPSQSSAPQQADYLNGTASITLTPRPRGHAAMKSLAAELDVNLPDLLVLARQNDPFCAGTPADHRWAEWFCGLWEQRAANTGVHLRRLHYQVLSLGVPQLDGMPYENTEECFANLLKASSSARAMGLVDPSSLVDRRNQAPILNLEQRWLDPEPDLEDSERSPWAVPAVQNDLAWRADYRLPAPEVVGYDYDPADQPVLVELWIEKSTMNDILVPLCEVLNINFVPSIGFQSITNAVGLCQRASQHNKPVRVLYISDFDPAGAQMPVAVARQIEFWCETFAPDADIKLTPIALTADQVAEYDLPRIPIKDSDRRRSNFETRHGSGAVELDALEALHPGALGRLVREQVAPYRDLTLSARLRETQDEADEAVREAWEETVADEQETIDEIVEEINAVVGNYQSELDDLRERMAADLAESQQRLDSVRQAVDTKADSFRVDLPDRPVGEIGDVDDDEWLFATERSYLEQLDAYRAHRNGSELER